MAGVDHVTQGPHPRYGALSANLNPFKPLMHRLAFNGGWINCLHARHADRAGKDVCALGQRGKRLYEAVCTAEGGRAPPHSREYRAHG